MSENWEHAGWNYWKLWSNRGNHDLTPFNIQGSIEFDFWLHIVHCRPKSVVSRPITLRHVQIDDFSLTFPSALMSRKRNCSLFPKFWEIRWLVFFGFSFAFIWSRLTSICQVSHFRSVIYIAPRLLALFRLQILCLPVYLQNEKTILFLFSWNVSTKAKKAVKICGMMRQ